MITRGMPMCSAAVEKEPVAVLREACVTVDQEEALKSALSNIGRVWEQTWVVKDVGKVVEHLPPIVPEAE